MNFSELNTLPWNEWMQLARQGDTRSTLRLCESAEPIINQFCHVPYFVCVLGKEETRSIAVLELLEFFMSYRGHTPDNEIPKLLKRIVKFELLHNTRWKQIRHKRERKEPDGRQKGRNETAADVTAAEAAAQTAGPETEPEAALLQAERAQVMQESLQCLTPREQAVIRSVYYRQRNMTEAAREMKCTPQAVWKVQRKALGKLRRLLKDRKDMLTDEAA